MADNTTWLVAGLAAGIGIGVGVALLINRDQGVFATQRPTMRETTVLRDDDGRIMTVQTLEGVGAGAAGPEAREPANIEVG